MSHHARPRTTPTSRPAPHTSAAAPSHCSGCRRPPLAWSMSAPIAATIRASPNVVRPSIDGSRRRRRRTGRRRVVV